jgi:YidC/Oxa1 family membrane protein insertase
MRTKRSGALVLCAAVGLRCSASRAVIRFIRAASIRSRTGHIMLNNPRVLVWGALLALLFLNYQAWLHDYGPADSAAASAAATQAAAKPDAAHSLDAAVPQTFSTDATATARAEHPAAPAAASATPSPDSTAEASADAPSVHVRTDVLDIDISLQGGTLVKADLLRYPRVKGGTEPVRLMNRDSEESFYELKSGLTGPADVPHPTQLATFTSPKREYELGSASELVVPLTWTDGQGVTVTKTFTLRRNAYRIALDYKVENRSTAPWQAAIYAQILRYDVPSARSMFFNVEGNAFHGPAIYDGTKYRKLKIDNADDRRLALDVRNGWLAALQHHFVGAIVPAADTNNRFTLSTQGRTFQLSTTGPLVSVAPDATADFSETLFVGPKLQQDLETTGPELARVADYGVLTIIARPLFLLLGRVHALFGNWGVAIIVVTFLLKLLFYPLSEASGRSMAKMKTLSPRIKNLQDTYKDDREKLGRAMMELYKREKINPVAGCLPIIIQIPVFLAFYWVLLESVEMRQAPFFGWINDLSSRDPLYILPAIMAGAMFVQYKLNPTPPDPVQAKVFMIMPLVMSVTFAFFPAGLVLYWVTNTLLSIAQQWNINRRIAALQAKRST